MDAGVPYGIALAASALMVYPETDVDGRTRNVGENPQISAITRKRPLTRFGYASLTMN